MIGGNKDFAVRTWLAQRLEGRVYYGWVVVAVISLANLGSFNLSPTFGLYIAPLEAEFGWDSAVRPAGKPALPCTHCRRQPL